MSFPPTMREIAERACVNRSTVSLALRNDSRLKLTTRKKIQALAAEMGYRQNPTVAHLMTQLRAGQQRHFQCNIAFLDFGSSGHIQPQTWTGADERAKMLGYGLEYFHVQNILPKRLEQILVHRGIRGVLISSPWGTSRLPDGFRSFWTKFACCVVGTHPSNPELHFTSDDNYLTSLTAVQKLSTLGFNRIGLAMHSVINSETDYRFVGGFLTAHVQNPHLEQLPILYLGPGDRSKFLSWYRRVKPKVVVCIQEEILGWLNEAGFRVPQKVGLVHLDKGVAATNWAGMRQNRAEKGAAAVDIVVSQINHNEIGYPPSQKATLTESVWEDGPSLEIPAKTKSRKSGICV